MTDAEWLNCDDLQPLIKRMRDGGKERKLRLFSCACARRLRSLATFALVAEAVDVAERVAEGDAPPSELRAVYEGARRKWFDAVPPLDAGAFVAGLAAVDARASEAARFAAMLVPTATVPPGTANRKAHKAEERRAVAGLFRCIFGGLFPPTSFSALWRTPAVLPLTHAAYDERLMPAGHLDATRLAILADALEEAGCEDGALLGHLRGPGPHVRGCWPLDAVLGKE